uniref:RdRp n=1 Tax=viral metagenome TaxID=1070528 RepID=A0A2V0RIW5_9ZZZZ
MTSISQLQRKREEVLRKRCQGAEEFTNMVLEGARPLAKEAMVEVGTSQQDQMFKCAKYFISIIERYPEAGREAMEMIEQWAIADRREENRNVVKEDFFPCVIRSVGEPDFQLKDRALVFTQTGMDKMLVAASARGEEGVGITNDDFSNGFVTNYASAKEILRVDDEHVVIRGVKLKKTPESARSGVPPADSDLSYTESWTHRWGEARRYTPFNLTTCYASWISLYESMGYSASNLNGWHEAKKRGGQHLLTGTLYLCCEWACRTGTPMSAKSKLGEDGNAASLLKAWIAGTTPKIPQWMNIWRGKMSYTMVSQLDVQFNKTNDLGLIEWSRQQLSKEIGAGKDGKTAGVGTKVPETRMPFVERADGGYPLQDAALTTMGPLRLWLCFSTALEVTGSSHLDPRDMDYGPFMEYYRGVLLYLGKYPGSVGRKLDKVIVQMYRLIAADLTIETPMSEIPKLNLDVAFKPETNMIDIYDRYAHEIIASNFDLDASADRMKLAEAICDKVPEVKPGLMRIFNEYSSSPEARAKYAVTLFETRVLDVLTHLAHPGNIEGYSRSCLGSLPVKGYKSYTQRLILEGIDGKAEERAVDEFERELFTDILEGMEIPSVEDLFIQMRKLSNSRSAGGDRINFESTPSTVTGMEDISGNTEGFMSNRKDVVHFSAALLMYAEYMMKRATPEEPFPLGLRSVAARVLRYIYNLPLVQQIILRPIYQRIKGYMRASSDGFLIEQREGVAVRDSIKEINTSIQCAKNDLFVVLAHDASGLDQHISVAHRRVWREVVGKLFDGIPTPGLKELLYSNKSKEELSSIPDVTYADLVKNVLSSWDDAYYAVAPPGAPQQLIHADTQPSGAITTGSDNTIVTMAMLRLMEMKTGMTQLSRNVWGDDCYVLHQVPKETPIVPLVNEQEAIAKGAGQVLGTVKDSTSGRVVHFLQLLFIGGTVVSRRMAYDHESPQTVERMPGRIGEYLDKAIKLASRGGNKSLLNMLQLMTISNGARTSIFGRQAITDFKSMAAPNGLTNRMLIGFSQPNAKLYLELNHRIILGSSEPIPVDKGAILDTPRDIGKRVVEDAQEKPVAVKLGGVKMQSSNGDNFTMRELQESASGVLLPKDRGYKVRSKSTLYGVLEESGLLEHNYYDAVKNAGMDAIGNVLREKRLAPKFKEKALMRSGYISSKANRTVKPSERTQIMSSLHTGIRIGSTTITYSFDKSPFIMYLPYSRTKDASQQFDSTKFHLQNSNGSISQSYDTHWHPYYSQPLHARLLLALTGIHGGTDKTKVKTHLEIFSPSHFRNDLTPEAVIRGIQSLKRKGQESLTRNYLRFVGFQDVEIERILRNKENIHLYEDLDDATEYSSLMDIAKSCSTQVVKDIISRTSGEAFVTLQSMDTDAKNVVITQYISLLCEELNVACTIPRLEGQARNFIRIPIIDVSVESQ